MLSATFASFAVLAASALAAPSIASFPANAPFDYQIGGAYTPKSTVGVVSRDRSQSPVTGKYNICYINAFQTQPGEKSFWTDSHQDLLLKNKNGQLFEDPQWKNEFFLDTSTDAKRQALATIINGWIDGCASKGFNAIEPDNLDTFSRSNNLLSKDNNLDFAKLFTTYAHSKGLAVGQKNTGKELGSNGKTKAGFDFAVVEECQEFKECDTYTDVYGSNVVEIEYTDADNAAQIFQDACDARKNKISIILRDRFVVPNTDTDYHYEEC